MKARARRALEMMVAGMLAIAAGWFLWTAMGCAPDWNKEYWNLVRTEVPDLTGEDIKLRELQEVQW